MAEPGDLNAQNKTIINVGQKLVFYSYKNRDMHSAYPTNVGVLPWSQGAAGGGEWRWAVGLIT